MKDVREMLKRLPEGQQKAMAVAVLWAIFVMSRNFGLSAVPAFVPGLLAVLAFVLVLPLQSKSNLRKTLSSFNLPLGLLLLWLGISIIIHPFPLTGLRCMRYIFLVLSMLLLSPLVVTDSLTKIRKVVATLVLAIVAAGVVASLLIWIYLVLSEIDIKQSSFFHFGYRGLFTSGITLSHMCGILAIVSFDMLLDSNRKKWLWGTAILIWVCGCILGGSRIAVTGMTIGLIMLAGFRFRRVRNLFNNGKAVMFALTLAIIGATILPFMADMIKYKQQFAADHGSLFASRTRLWNARAYEFEHYPLTGIGYANELQVHTLDYPDPSVMDDFNAILGPDFQFQPEIYVEPDAFVQPTPRLQLPSELEPGSSWLSVLSQGGIPAGIFLLWFFIDLFRKARRNRQEPLFPLCFSILFFFLLSGFVEGWLLFAGTIRFSLFWLNASLLSANSSK